MAEPRSLKISGYHGSTVHSQYKVADKPSGWLGILLPGLNYSMDMPLMFFTREMLLWRGVDVLNLNPAARSAEFQSASEGEQLSWLQADLQAGIQAGLAQKNYRGLILAGKSIGTLALATIGASIEDKIETAWVWITPLLRRDVVMQAAMGVKGRQAFLCGGADSTYKASRMEQILARQPLASAYIADSANHSLEVPGDDQKTFTGFSKAMIFLGKFLDQDLSTATTGEVGD